MNLKSEVGKLGAEKCLGLAMGLHGAVLAEKVRTRLGGNPNAQRNSVGMGRRNALLPSSEKAGCAGVNKPGISSTGWCEEMG
jgi:hypothetical protein